jgi:hypothetical protein
VDKKVDLGIFDCKYNNDETGAEAIELRILLMLIIYGSQMLFLQSQHTLYAFSSFRKIGPVGGSASVKPQSAYGLCVKSTY